MMTLSTGQGPARPQGLTGRHVLAVFLGFFGVVFAVNGYFLSVALSTYSGVVAVEPYRKGLHYNDRIAAAERQDALGWHDEIALALDGSRLTLSLRGADGAPVTGLQVSASVGRPATTAEDISLPLAETAPGRYEGALALVEHGAYVATIEARRAEAATGDAQPDKEPAYRVRKRLWLDR